jgi:metal-responsive CopG/Arc/MetJ family transcriptional regulator
MFSMAAASKVERIHVTLSQADIEQIDDYRFTARLDSRSEALRQLVFIALEGKLPQDHINIVRHLKESWPNVQKHNDISKTERLHITLHPAELEQIDDYRFASRIETRSDAIRQLSHAALNDILPEKHMQALQKMRENRFPQFKIKIPAYTP